MIGMQDCEFDATPASQNIIHIVEIKFNKKIPLKIIPRAMHRGKVSITNFHIKAFFATIFSFVRVQTLSL